MDDRLQPGPKMPRRRRMPQGTGGERRTSGTLPLFEGLEPVSASTRVDAGDPAGDFRGNHADGPGGSTVGRREPSRPGQGDPHLRAAWRLSRAMWRFPDHSPQQTKAGLAICQHLQALLAEAEDAAPR